MRHLNQCIMSKIALISLLGLGSIGLSACSSPEEDARVREEPTEHIDAQEPVEQEAIHTSGEAVSHEHTDDVAVATATNTDDVAVAAEEGHIDVGTHNNPEVLDGTDEVEHVSTY